MRNLGKLVKMTYQKLICILIIYKFHLEFMSMKQLFFYRKQHIYVQGNLRKMYSFSNIIEIFDAPKYLKTFKLFPIHQL